MNRDEEIREKLSDLNKILAPYQLAWVNPAKDCVQLEKNAHYMDRQVQERLTENIKEDGFLSQLPFAMKQDDGRYLILSGNHRIKSAIAAKLENVLILYIDKVSKSKQLAYTISHNAIFGKDDVRILKELLEEIDNVKDKEFSGLNGMDFRDVKDLSLPSIGDCDVQLTEIKFLFVESKKHDIEKVLETLGKAKISEDSSLVYGSFEEFIKVSEELRKKFGIRNITASFSFMVDLCKQKLKEIEESENSPTSA